MSTYRVHGKGEFSTRNQEDIWLFHLHGFRRFFMYLGPKYYSIFSTVVPKFARYVLNAPRVTREVKTLKLSTRFLFVLHILMFAPLVLLKLFHFRPYRRSTTISGESISSTINEEHNNRLQNKGIRHKVGHFYYLLFICMPPLIKKPLISIVKRVPELYRLKLALFDFFVGQEKRQEDSR